ncbi:MAG: pentapeptide repeat-containing protein, partial [Epsilonproteobacteria bacterium]|nr:pentapeptide repeat-containing protein [Campylobacterota bacterium]
MKKITQEELNEILALHMIWLKSKGIQGAMADLQGVIIKDANLRSANLKDANLQGAVIYDTDLRGANLEDANLQGVKTRNLLLSGVNLNGANLSRASLIKIDLS